MPDNSKDRASSRNVANPLILKQPARAMSHPAISIQQFQVSK
ncbi:hypothetical protein C7S14_1231 [Burkholderia cepacia]|nr:hypothetical protein C7S14_1231 [Burkholderia cepacia]